MSHRALEILIMADCPRLEKLVLLAIAHHGQGVSGSGAFPGIRRIARIAGASVSSTQVALRALKERGWLDWTPGNAKENAPNRYTINVDAIPMLDFDLYRPASQAYAGDRHRPVPGPVPVAGTGLYRSGLKPVPVTGTESTTEPINHKNRENLSRPTPAEREAALLDHWKQKAESAPAMTREEIDRAEKQHAEYKARRLECAMADPKNKAAWAILTISELRQIMNTPEVSDNVRDKAKRALQRPTGTDWRN